MTPLHAAAQALLSNIRGDMTQHDLRLLDDLRAAIAVEATAEPVAPPQLLSDDDISLLMEVHEALEDDEGHTLTKPEVSRLCELGALRNCGFGRVSVTVFGRYAIDAHFGQGNTLPFKTFAEYNETSRLAMEERNAKEQK